MDEKSISFIYIIYWAIIILEIFLLEIPWVAISLSTYLKKFILMGPEYHIWSYKDVLISS